MTETASFKVRVIDDSTKQALAIQASLKSVESQLKSLDRAAAKARGPEAIKRFDLGDKRKQLVGQRRALAVSTRQQEVAARRVAAQQAKSAKERASTIGDALSAMPGAGGIGGALTAGGAIGAAIFAAQALAEQVKRAVVAVVELGVAFSKASIDAAMFAQDSKLAIGALTGSAAVANQQFAEVRQEAALLGQDVRGTVDGFRKLLSAQFDVGMARDLVRMSADLSVAGANVEKALLAISQIKMKGFLQGEELTGQLAEAGVSAELVYQALEKRLGKTRKQIMAMQRGGQIKADVAIEAILSAAKKKTGVEEFGELARKRAEETLSGASAALSARVENMFIDIGEAITPALDKIAPKIFGLFDAIVSNPKVQELGQFLLQGLNKFADWVEKNWPKIEGIVVANVDRIASVFLVAGKSIKFVSDNWSAFGAGAQGVLGMFIGPLQIASAQFDAFGLAVTSVGSLITGAFDSIKSSGGNLIQGLIDGISSKLESLRAVMTQVAALPDELLRKFWQERSPSRLFMERGELAMKGLEIGLASNDNAIQGATASAAMSAVDGTDNAIQGATASMGAAAVDGAGSVAGIAAASGAGNVVYVQFGDIIVGGDASGSGAEAGERFGREFKKAVGDELNKFFESV